MGRSRSPSHRSPRAQVLFPSPQSPYDTKRRAFAQYCMKGFFGEKLIGILLAAFMMATVLLFS